MEITGRLTADAQVNTLKDERQVVHFSIAINDSYKPKGSDEIRQVTTYINCSYWLSAKPANWLKKGALVQLYGRIGMNAYVNSQGEAAGSLTFHVNDLKVLAFPKQREENKAVVSGQVAKAAAETDDLPF
ncbi:single-stranded DNA-binding protein [Rubrolithibacter danxiaensis]|uniref:single-stranded DNA-binding protein n=1 Tax=Rubrolithibacter danxiaensis TaxID=3390805 RepID=UPI003BF89063